MTLDQYITSINQRFQLGNATEHTFRGDLQVLIESLVPEIRATNEPKRQKCGAPDYIITKKEIPIGFIEAKDIGDKDLDGTKLTGNKEQFDRYKGSLGNLIFTDYINFHLYHDGIFVTKIAIAELQNGKILPLQINFTAFTNLIKEFCSHKGQTIKNSKKLAEMMAGKARLLSDVIERALVSDENNSENSSLKEQMNGFKDILIHDITPKGFADVYAQTIAYGMFAARLHDPTLDDFSRQEAAELIPKSNPFLRKLFGYIAGPDIDDRIKWIVDNLVEIFLACNVADLLKDYGKATKMEDPIIHFYETFLSEYDPKLRKARGVWYTPQPVVNFIVRAVDDILKTEFDLPQGLADTSKTKIKIDYQGKKIEQEVHKVQILDPAAGTGTFLAEVIKLIHKKFEGQQGIWSNYVETQLLPRLNGFELLMASYAMAHLKLDLLLTETGYKPTDASLQGTKQSQRLKVFLTNSLEEHHPDSGTLFANWLSEEANAANQIKRDTPVMCIIGNPPYAVSSTNKNEWIEKLISDYKKDLNEKSYNSLSDDYVKFIRYGQYFVDKNGSGILAYISNNSFIDGLVFRQMRKHLLESFDQIYILDLHGNAKKKEVCPDGSADKNVFDIMQGVSINIFVKTGKKKKSDLGKVHHLDIQGQREFKYDFLNENNLHSLKWNKLEYSEPNYFFTNKNFTGENEYQNGFKSDDLFNIGASGLTTERDNITIQFEFSVLNFLLEDFKILDEQTLRSKYDKKPDGRDWKYSFAKNDIQSNKGKIININYRPFDYRKTYYTGKSKGFMAYPRNDVMFHFVDKENIGLVVKRGFDNIKSACGFITKNISDRRGWSSPGMQGAESIFPLYLYSETNGQQTIEQTKERTPNLNKEIINQISEKLNLSLTNEKETTENTFAPIDILDYIYAVLHSPTYREKYKEFLKIDFPRVPYPKDTATFWQLVKLGGEIRQIHLLESPVVDKYITQYPIDGNNLVEKIKYQNGNVFINDLQYFANVPEIAWNFYIGGYQPAQKWLKDRKGRTLDFEDILHYQKIIVALTETDRIMKEIDKIEIE
jgi:predicted helicase